MSGNERMFAAGTPAAIAASAQAAPSTTATRSAASSVSVASFRGAWLTLIRRAGSR